MTEEEAFKKWCPFARVVNGEDCGDGKVFVASGQSAANRILMNGITGTSGEAGLCIASACMAWRTYTYYPAGIDILKADPFKDKITGGYCGLAGKP